jgi:signal transduction histidine kinase
LHNAKLRTQLWYLRRQTALFVHGEVQSALTSSAMELEKSATDEGARTRIIQRLQKGLADLRERQERPLVLEEALADIQGTWAGVAQVSWSLHDIGASQIDAQPAVSASVAEIVRESVSNAIRHGDASEIRVELRLVGGGELSIRITDNGRGIANSDSRGLGSSMLDETCLWWERTRVNEATTLRAIVAF